MLGAFDCLVPEPVSPTPDVVDDWLILISYFSATTCKTFTFQGSIFTSEKQQADMLPLPGQTASHMAIVVPNAIMELHSPIL